MDQTSIATRVVDVPSHPTSLRSEYIAEIHHFLLAFRDGLALGLCGFVWHPVTTVYVGRLVLPKVPPRRSRDIELKKETKSQNKRMRMGLFIEPIPLPNLTRTPTHRIALWVHYK